MASAKARSEQRSQGCDVTGRAWCYRLSEVVVDVVFGIVPDLGKGGHGRGGGGVGQLAIGVSRGEEVDEILALGATVLSTGTSPVFPAATLAW
jgi:hypothetical protein